MTGPAPSGAAASPSGADRTLVTGGARSGKSVFAEWLVADAPAVEYVATSGPDDDDPEWLARIAVHRARRPAHWSTTETLDLAGVLSADASPVLLVDCLGTWITRVMDEVGCWTDAPGATDALRARVDALLDALAATRRRVVLVTNEVGSGIVPATPSGRFFRDELGRLNARVAATCDHVWLCAVGIPLRLKGSGA